jgi:hypothetical protein
MTKTITKRLCGSLLAGVLTAGPALGQAPEAKPPAVDQAALLEVFAKLGAVGDNHKLLAGMAGEWTMHTKMWMDPAQPPQESSGSVSAKMIMGGRYLQAAHTSTMMSQPFEGVSLTAYDNLTRKFVATWVDSMSTGIFYQTGSYDPATRTFTYTSEMPDPMTPGKMLPVRTTTRLVDADTYVFEWYETHDGREARTMEITYKRKK